MGSLRDFSEDALAASAQALEMTLPKYFFKD